MPEWTPPTAARIRAVHRRLGAEQGLPEPKPGLPPLDELVMTILSQHTSDVNTARAYRSLRERFADWDAVLHAPTEAVENAIRVGGLAQRKAVTIQRVLHEVGSREGILDLGRLQKLTDAEVRDYLLFLPGVGPKTAACVLLFSMGRPAFPVDTHVERVTGRLGWTPPRATAPQVHSLLEPRIPPELRYPLHLELIRHGRQVCRAAHPRCERCVLRPLCPRRGV